jgi:hypothetical protein
MSKEEWRDIPGYPGAKVSDQGRVIGTSGRVLKTQKINSGYLIVHLCKGGVRRAVTVHRLVAFAFVPAFIARPHVNHKNGNKEDNRAVNLEWCDVSRNALHAYATGLREPPRFAVIGVSKTDGSVVRFDSQRDAEIALSGPKKQSSAINHCLDGKKKSAYGYTWSRA